MRKRIGAVLATLILTTGAVLGIGCMSAYAVGERGQTCKVGVGTNTTTFSVGSYINGSGTRTWHAWGVDKTYSSWHFYTRFDFYGAYNGRTGNFYSGQNVWWSAANGSPITWRGQFKATNRYGQVTNLQCSATA
jgi:hypothetical protein